MSGAFRGRCCFRVLGSVSIRGLGPRISRVLPPKIQQQTCSWFGALFWLKGCFKASRTPTKTANKETENREGLNATENSEGLNAQVEDLRVGYTKAMESTKCYWITSHNKQDPL